MEAIILAGGRGTRLKSVVADLPKTMAPVKGRPFLALLLDRLVDSGFEKAILAVGYRHEAIRSHFGERYRSLTLRYSVETAPLGTGGAIKLAWEQVSDPEVFILNGDTYLELDYLEMLDAHERSEARLSMAICFVEDASRYGALDLAEGKVRGFREKGRAGPGWVNAGVYIMGTELPARFPAQAAFSFEHDFLVPGVAHIRPLAFQTDGLFVDIGIPEEYDRAQILFSSLQTDSRA